MHVKIKLHLVQRCLQITAVLLISSAIPPERDALRFATPLRAQPVPPTLIPPPRPETAPLPARPTTPPLPPDNNLLHPPTAPTPGVETLPATAPGIITVKQFRFVGNTAFSSKRLAQVLAGFTNRPIAFADLFKARSAINEFYVSHGYITSGALLPSQTLRGGVITIQVVEGKLERIEVRGVRRLSRNYVRSRLRLAASKALNQNRLLEALQLLQLNPLIKNISAKLSAGTSPNTSVLEVQVTEAKTFSTQAIIDNNRPPSVGSFERGLQLNQANLLGLGDSLSAGYTNTDGTNNLNAFYTLPFNPRNGTFSFYYGATWSHVIVSPFNRLNINVNYRYYEATLRQPLIQTPTQEFALGLTGSRRESDSNFLGTSEFASLISPGADNRGRTRISALRFFQEWTKRNKSSVLAARSQFSLGIGALDATIHRSAPDSRFFSWQGQGQWARLLAPDTLLVVRGDIQLASRPLVPLEQFGLGGIETVRGYPQSYLLTDNAVLGSIELRLPIFRAPRGGAVLQLVPSFDIANGWNNSASSSSRQQSSNSSNTSQTLASIGAGLRLQLSNNLSVRFDWGHPLINNSFRKRTWQENGLYFSVQYNPF